MYIYIHTTTIPNFIDSACRFGKLTMCQICTPKQAHNIQMRAQFQYEQIEIFIIEIIQNTLEKNYTKYKITVH